ncbi:unnamed protein product [Trichobilharzia regenti]|nr:unnamed protein product [Trichobilharzia regenti]
MTSNPFILPDFETIFELRDKEKEEKLKEGRKRAMMVDKIKQLTLQKSQINAEITRLKETVKDYKYFKGFIERLIPEPFNTLRQNTKQNKQQMKYRQKLLLESFNSKPSSIGKN